MAGLIWLAYALPGRDVDHELFTDVGAFFRTFFHVAPTAEQLRTLIEVG